MKAPNWTTEVSYPSGEGMDYKARSAAYDAAFKARWDAENAFQATLPKGLAVGKIVRFQIADGYAYYRVTKVGKRTSRLKWQALGHDSYTEYVLGFEGSMPTAKVAALVTSEEAMRELFARKVAS